MKRKKSQDLGTRVLFSFLSDDGMTVRKWCKRRNEDERETYKSAYMHLKDFYLNLSDEIEEAVLLSFEKLNDYKKVAAETGIEARVVHIILNHYYPYGEVEKIQEESRNRIRKEVIELLKYGFSTRMIARKVGISQVEVSKIKVEVFGKGQLFNQEKQNSQNSKTVDKEKVKALWNARNANPRWNSISEIARDCHCSQYMVDRILKNAN